MREQDNSFAIRKARLDHAFFKETDPAKKLSQPEYRSALQELYRDFGYPYNPQNHNMKHEFA